MHELPTIDQMVPASGPTTGQWVTWTENGEQYRVVSTSEHSVVLHFSTGWDFCVPRSQILEGVS